MMRTLVLLLGLVLTTTVVSAQSPSVPPAVRAAVRMYVAAHNSAAVATTRIATAPLPRAGAADAVVVYLMGDGWCGTGGCTLLVLTPARDGYQLVTKVPIVQLPVRVLAHQSHGWPDLAVRVCGGGIRGCYDVRLRYDGQTYPHNASLAPKSHGRGQVLLGERALEAGEAL